MQIFTVGGWVRDSLMGLTPKDKDYVVVGATPEEMIEQGYVQVGADFPVFLHPETKEEYALARKERKVAAGYHGFETEFDISVTLKEDLSRRDLTINSMAIDDEGNIIDPFNGYADLSAGILRHVSPAFAEDPLRVLRVARFAARYPDFKIAKRTMDLMKEIVQKGELEHLSKERIVAEFEKSFSADDSIMFLSVLNQCGAMKIIFPQLNVYNIVYSTYLLVPAKNKFAYLLYITGCDAFEIVREMKAPIEYAQFAENLHRVEQAFDSGTSEEWVKTFDYLKVSHDITPFVKALNFLIDYNIRRNMLRDFAKLVSLCEAYRSISIKDIPEGLKGKAISEAIRDKRISKIDNWFST